MMISYLYVTVNTDLIYFKRKTNLSWGNISTHASKLEEAGYITIKKIFRNKKPVTVLEITEEGRIIFEKYRKIMKKFIG